jgi:hypothetical protein
VFLLKVTSTWLACARSNDDDDDDDGGDEKH